MENTENTEETLETTALSLEQAFRLVQAAREAERRAIVDTSDTIRLLAQAAGSKTFSYHGKLYQVRERLNKELDMKLAFLCELEVEPKVWLNEARQRRLMETTAAEVGSTAGAASDTPELGDDELVVLD